MEIFLHNSFFAVTHCVGNDPLCKGDAGSGIKMVLPSDTRNTAPQSIKGYFHGLALERHFNAVQRQNADT